MSKPNDNLLQELLELIGTEKLPQMSTEDINELLQKGVPLALREQLNLITGPTQERVKAWMIKEWLDRSGFTPVTKIAVAKKITLDDKTLRILQAISEEDDTTIDTDFEVCEKARPTVEVGSGPDPAQPEVEMQEVALLSEQGGPGVSGPDPRLPSQDVQVRPGPDDPSKAG
jgi:hypothetical protein